MLMHALAASCEELRARTGNPPLYVYFRKRFLMGLYKGGLIYGGGDYTWTIFCVSNKQVRHKTSQS